MVSASLTSDPANGVGAGLSTYSGRGMWAGTSRRGETDIGATGVTADECSFGAMKYWYCVKHHRVESGENICPPIDRLGPYTTEEEASRALQKAEERNEEWDNDPNWNDADLED